MYVQYSDGLLKSITAAKKELTTTRVREIYNNIRTREYKSSTIVTEEKKASYDAALGKKLNPKEGKYLNDLTPYVNGTVVLSYLNAKNGGKPYLLAELNFRDQKKWRDVPAATKNTMKEKDLQHFLRGFERTRLDDEEGIQHECDDHITEFKPLSPEMKEWLEIHQVRIANEKNSK